MEPERIHNTIRILSENKELVQVLDHPEISNKDKAAVIKVIFHKDMVAFLRLLSELGEVAQFQEIVAAYEAIHYEENKIKKAILTYVTYPETEELELLKQILCEKYKVTGVSMELKEDPSLLGGYLLTIDHTEYDKSIKGTLHDMHKTLVRR